MDLKKINESKVVRDTIIVIGIIIVVLGILRVGMSLGERRARFAGAFGDNFERNFVGQRGGMMERGMMGGFWNDKLPSAYGAVGTILSINLPQVVINGQDNLEKTVLVSTSTAIRLFQENVLSSNLKIGDYIIVIGNPNSNGQIEARLIRVAPQQTQTSTSTPVK
jgi:hypothetical protein